MNCSKNLVWRQRNSSSELQLNPDILKINDNLCVTALCENQHLQMELLWRELSLKCLYKTEAQLDKSGLLLSKVILVIYGLGFLTLAASSIVRIIFLHQSARAIEGSFFSHISYKCSSCFQETLRDFTHPHVLENVPSFP